MADDIDLITERDLGIDALIHSQRYNIPAGTPGECDECGEHSPRLIGGRCAPCRDGRPR